MIVGSPGFYGCKQKWLSPSINCSSPSSFCTQNLSMPLVMSKSLCSPTGTLQLVLSKWSDWDLKLNTIYEYWKIFLFRAYFKATLPNPDFYLLICKYIYFSIIKWYKLISHIFWRLILRNSKFIFTFNCILCFFLLIWTLVLRIRPCMYVFLIYFLKLLLDILFLIQYLINFTNNRI